MTYKEFQSKVNAIIGKTGGGIPVRFFNDTEKGSYTARCGDITIIGRPSGFKVTVRFGSGHQAMAAI